MAPTQQPRTDFVKALSRLDATALVVGSMIGSGIFIVSADILRQVHAPAVLLLVWALSGVVTLMGALAYGELAAMFPRAGGQYVYLREGISPLFGYLYGWTLFLVIQTGTIAAVAVAGRRGRRRSGGRGWGVPLSRGMGAAMVVSRFARAGWSSAACAGPGRKAASRDLPFPIAPGTLTVTVLGRKANGAYLNLLPA